MKNLLKVSLIIVLILSVNQSWGKPNITSPIQVTTTGGMHPTASPDGEWVAFRHDGLAKIKTDGSEFTQLTEMNSCYDPDWARHNDSLIVFRHSDSTLGTALLIINAYSLDTSFFFGGVFDDDPTWAPDGNAIAVQNSSPDGIRIISNPDTSITDVPCTVPAGGSCDGEGPSWSPGSDSIAFENGMKIMKVARTGGTAIQVVGGLNDVGSPAWSPDGNYIAFGMDDATDSSHHIWVADVKGADSGLWQVTEGIYSDGRPAWSPNSDTIYFESNRTGESEIWKVAFIKEAQGIESEITNIPSGFWLKQNYPNPFNPATTIEYSITSRSHVNISIYNIIGQKIKTLFDGEKKSGSYSIDWDGTDARGDKVATGIYFYGIQAGHFSDMKKMILLR